MLYHLEKNTWYCMNCMRSHHSQMFSYIHCYEVWRALLQWRVMWHLKTWNPLLWRLHMETPSTLITIIWCSLGSSDTLSVGYWLAMLGTNGAYWSGQGVKQRCPLPVRMGLILTERGTCPPLRGPGTPPTAPPGAHCHRLVLHDQAEQDSRQTAGTPLHKKRRNGW